MILGPIPAGIYLTDLLFSLLKCVTSSSNEHYTTTTHRFTALISILPLANTLVYSALLVPNKITSGWGISGCHRPDRYIWALSTVLALPICCLHCKLCNCRVSYRDSTHKYQFTDEGSWVRPLQSCVHGVCPGTHHFEIKTEVHCSFRAGKKGEKKRKNVFMWVERSAFPCQFKESLAVLWIKCHWAAEYTHTRSAWQLNGAHMHVCTFMHCCEAQHWAEGPTCPIQTADSHAAWWPCKILNSSPATSCQRQCSSPQPFSLLSAQILPSDLEMQVTHIAATI